MDLATLAILCELAGLTVHRSFHLSGKTDLDRKLRGYNAAARHSTWIVFRDLDHDANCAPTLVDDLLDAPAPGMNLRIAVRELESWFLADSDSMAKFLGVAPLRIPVDPEELADPKQTLINLARHSRRRDIREYMPPRQGSGAIIGPGYNTRLLKYATQHWRPNIAAERSDSLARCIRCLENIVPV